MFSLLFFFDIFVSATVVYLPVAVISGPYASMNSKQVFTYESKNLLFQVVSRMHAGILFAGNLFIFLFNRSLLSLPVHNWIPLPALQFHRLLLTCSSVVLQP